jgi:hypothetical protein
MRRRPKRSVIGTTTARPGVTPFHAVIRDARAQSKSRAHATRGAS